MEIRVQTFPAEILTGYYQISGGIEILGNPTIYVNDATFSTFNIHDATLTPLTPGTPVGPVQVPKLFLPKSEPQVLLIGDFSPHDAQLLPNKIKLICFTSAYVIRGVFHAGPETQATDVFYALPGPFFPATDVDIYPIRPMSTELGGQADLVFVHRDAVRAFHSF
jgi:hypothetical protein